MNVGEDEIVGAGVGGHDVGNNFGPQDPQFAPSTSTASDSAKVHVHGRCRRAARLRRSFFAVLGARVMPNNNSSSNTSATSSIALGADIIFERNDVKSLSVWPGVGFGTNVGRSVGSTDGRSITRGVGAAAGAQSGAERGIGSGGGVVLGAEIGARDGAGRGARVGTGVGVGSQSLSGLAAACTPSTQ